MRLRVRSGATFDLAGKGGTMALLGDVLFSDPATREYVTDQLGGKLDVTTTYDGIDITISGKASELERMVDLLRIALITPQLTVENVARVREARLKQFSDKPISAAEIADQAIAARLFGNFPYGHPAAGTFETVSSDIRADRKCSSDFLADNSQSSCRRGLSRPVPRTLRQLLGPWHKANPDVPSRSCNPPSPAPKFCCPVPGQPTRKFAVAMWFGCSELVTPSRFDPWRESLANAGNQRRLLFPRLSCA